MKPSFSRSLLGRSSTLAMLAMLGFADAAGAVDITINGENRPGVSNAGLLEFIYVTGSTINGNVTNLPAGVIDPGAGNDAINISNSTVTGSVLNQGRIIDSDSGILVTQSSIGGNVGNSGTIEAALGIDVYGNSTVSGNVFNSGTIIADDTGIYLYDSLVRGNVTNSGRIEADNIGIYVTDMTIGGGIFNSGWIDSGSTGIWVSDSTIAGGVHNSGTIRSSGSYGIYLYSFDSIGGGITNSGTIDSYYTGIVVSAFNTFTGGIQNSGLIESSSLGIYVYDFNTFAGGISNSGTIRSYYTGIMVSNFNIFNGGISNSGTIDVDSSYGIYVYNFSTFNGGITNSGEIDAYYAGIYVYSFGTFTGGINNSGVVEASSYGIYVTDGSSFGGGIVNSGTIDSYYTGIYVYSLSEFSGGIANSGLIDSRSSLGIYVTSVGSFGGGINNSGTIDAYSTAVYVYSVDTFTGGFQNSGVIESDNSYGVHITSFGTFTGGIENSGTIESYYFGIDLWYGSSFAGGIVNSGVIDTDEIGIYVYSVSTVQGGINNSGLIDARATGIYQYNADIFAGGITNSGTIESDGSYGVYVYLNDTFDGSINNSGVINSYYTAVYFYSNTTVTGGITNSGTIDSDFSYGVYVYNTDTFAGGIANSGLIDAYYTGLYVYSVDTLAGGISNSGTIRSDFGLGIYAYDFDSLGGGVANSGVIETYYTGIYIGTIDTLTGGISNSGTIDADYSYGIYIYAIDNLAGGISNSGRIETTGTGLYVYSVDTISGGISNSGEIDSDDSLGIYLYNTRTLTGDVSNSGRILVEDTGIYVLTVDTIFGSVTHRGTIDSWSSYGSYRYNIETMSGGVTNSGLINTYATGLTLYSVDTVAGDVTNSGTILVSPVGGSIGIYIYNTTIQGALINTGLIDPTTAIYVSSSSIAGGIRNSGTIVGSSYAMELSNMGNDVDIFLEGGAVVGEILLPTGGIATIFASGGDVFGDITGDGDDILNVEGDWHIDGNVTTMDEVNANAGTGTFHGDVDGQTFSLADGARAIMGVDVDNDTGFTGTFVNPWNANPGGTLAVEAAGAEGGSAAGQWIFGAGSTVDGTFQAVILPDLYEDVTTYTGVVQSAGYAGAFSNVSDTSAFLTAELVYNANDIDLVLTRTPFNQVPGGGSNATGLGGVLENVYQDYLGGNPIDPDALAVVQTLFATSGGDVNEFMAQVAGSTHAQAGYLGQAIMQQVYGFLQNRMNATRNFDPSTQVGGQSAERGQLAALGDSDTIAGLTQEAAGNSNSVMDRPANSFSAWGEGLAGFGTRDGDANAQGYDRDSWGAAVGVDYLLGETMVFGVAGHYLATSAEFDGYGDETDVDSFGFSIYGSWQPGFLYVDVGANVSFNSYETSRFLPVGLGSEEFKADYDGTSFGFYAETGWRFEVGQFALTPSAGVAYTNISTDSFTEEGVGSGLALHSDGIDADSLTTTLMLRASTALNLGGMVLVPELRAGWQHEFLDEPETEMQLIGIPNSPFTVVGSEVASDSALVGASLTLGVMSNVEVFVDYDARFGGDDTSHAIGLGGRVAF